MRWARPEWRLPTTGRSTNPRWLLVPTIESSRLGAVLTLAAEVCGCSVLLTGGQGTGKTATVSLFLESRVTGAAAATGFLDAAQIAAVQPNGLTMVSLGGGVCVCGSVEKCRELEGLGWWAEGGGGHSVLLRRYLYRVLFVGENM